MLYSLLSTVTFALVIVWGSANSSERPCFKPPLENKVVESRTIPPYEYIASGYIDWYNMMGVEVKAERHNCSLNETHTVEGMFISLGSTLK